jgi:hypothetical protein
VKRPFAVTILGGLFIVVGFVGLAYHLWDRPLEHGIILVCLLRLIAVIGGVLLLMGRGWARWMMLAWLALHIVVSAFHSLSESLAHVVLLIVVAYLLLRPPASNYFRSEPSG